MRESAQSAVTVRVRVKASSLSIRELISHDFGSTQFSLVNYLTSLQSLFLTSVIIACTLLENTHFTKSCTCRRRPTRTPIASLYPLLPTQNLSRKSKQSSFPTTAATQRTPYHCNSVLNHQFKKKPSTRKRRYQRRHV
jgi:hypothetical protein